MFTTHLTLIIIIIVQLFMDLDASGGSVALC